MDLGYLVESDVIHEFQELQNSENRLLLHEIATGLKELGTTSTEQLKKILPLIVQGGYSRPVDAHGADEITEHETSPEERIRSAFGKLPARLRGDDVIEAFESLNRPHPRTVLAAQGEAYMETINARLMEVNAKRE